MKDQNFEPVMNSKKKDTRLHLIIDLKFLENEKDPYYDHLVKI